MPTDTGDFDFAAGFDAEVGSSQAPTQGLFNEPVTPDALDIDFSDLSGHQQQSDSAFWDSVQRGADSTQAMLYGASSALAGITGMDGMAEWGAEGFKEQMAEAALNPIRVESYEDIDSLATFGTYIAEALGENVINIAMIATGAGVTATAAKAMVGKAAIKQMGKKAAEKAALKKGAKVGTFGSSYPLGVGEVQGDFITENIDAPGTALLAGIPIAALDALSITKIAESLFKGVPTTNITGALKTAAKGFGFGAANEMPTEAAQEFIGLAARAYEDPTFELFTEENLEQIVNAGVKGAIVGGVLGGGPKAAISAIKGTAEQAKKVVDKAAEKKAALKERLKGALDPADIQVEETPVEEIDYATAFDNELDNEIPDITEEVVAASEDRPGGPTNVESKATLQASIDAAVENRGGRIASYSADPKGYDGTDYPEGYEVIPAKDGGAYLVAEADAAQVRAMDRAGRQHKILGYPAEKPLDGKGIVVQAKDAKGRTVQDVVTDEKNLDATIAQAKQAMGRGGSVNVMHPEQALNERAQGVKENVEYYDEEGYPVSPRVTAAVEKGDVTDAIEYIAETTIAGPSAPLKAAKRLATEESFGFETLGDSQLSTAARRIVTGIAKKIGVKIPSPSTQRRVVLVPSKAQQERAAVIFGDAQDTLMPRGEPTQEQDRDLDESIQEVLIKFNKNKYFEVQAGEKGHEGGERLRADLDSTKEHVIKGFIAVDTVVEELAKKFGVQGPVFGIAYGNPNRQGWAAAAGNTMGIHHTALERISRGLADENLGQARSAQTAEAFETVFHEFGHLLQFSILKMATPTEQQAVFEAYDTFLKETKGKRAFNVDIDRAPLATKLKILQGANARGYAGFPELNDYVVDAGEWFANESAKYIGTEYVSGNLKLDSLGAKVNRAFQDLYKMLVAIFKENGFPAPAIKEFLDTQIAMAKKGDIVTVNVNGEPIDNVTGQVKSKLGRASEYDEDSKIPVRDAEGRAITDDEGIVGQLTDEAVQQEPQTVTVKHNTTARLLNKIYGATSTTNKDGSRDVTLPAQDPRQTQGDPNMNHPTVVKAIAKVFDDGKTEERARMDVSNPHSKKGTNTRVNLQSVMQLGRALNKLNDTRTDDKANMLTGLGWLMENGFMPKRLRVKENGKFKNKDITGELKVLPMNTVVSGSEENGTARTYGQVLNTGQTKEQKKLIDELDEKQAILKAIYAKPSGPQRFQIIKKHKANPNALYKRIRSIKEQLAEKYGMDLKRTGQEDAHEIEQYQEAKVTREADLDTTQSEEAIDRFATKLGGQKSSMASKGAIRDIEAPLVEDTRNLPTEADQMADSIRDRGSKQQMPPAGSELVYRDGRVAVLAPSLHKEAAGFAAKVLKMLGIKTQVNIVDETGVLWLINEWKRELSHLGKTDPRRQVLSVKISDHEALLSAPPRGKIIYNDNFFRAPVAKGKEEQGHILDRVPTIFVSQNVTRRGKQIVVLTHEIGHLLQRVAFDQAPQEVQDAITRSMAPIRASQSNTFEENFANMLYRYLVKKDVSLAALAGEQLSSKNQTKEERKAQMERMADLRPLHRFFKALARKLRSVWTMGAKVSHPVAEAYEDFVDAMVQVKAMQDNLPAPTSVFGKRYVKVVEELTMGPFLPYNADVTRRMDNHSPDNVAALGQTAARLRRAKALLVSAKHTGKGLGSAALDVYGLAKEKVLQSADAVLRGYNSPFITDIANAFHHQPGLRKAGRAFFEEVRYWQAQKQRKIDKILNGLPQIAVGQAWWKVHKTDKESTEYKELMKLLQTGTSEAEFARMGGTVGKVGQQLRQFFDNEHAWLSKQGVNFDKRANYFPMFADVDLFGKASERNKIIDLFKKHGMPRDYAEQVIDAIKEENGDIEKVYRDEQDAMLGPGFRFAKKRKLPEALISDLQEYMIDDLPYIMTQYSKASTERGITMQKWGMTADNKMKMAGEFKVLGIEDHINSPVAKLHLAISRAHERGEITVTQARFIKHNILEGYFGRLGASSTDARWQKFQSAAIVYQNIRLLSMATLTTISEAALLAWRSRDMGVAWDGVKAMMDKSTREEMYEFAYDIGAIDDATTAHVLNDQTTNQWMSQGARTWNETFFRITGMHQWTKLARVAGLHMARGFLAENAAAARNGDAKAIKALEELGVTPEEVEAWQNQGEDRNNIGFDNPHAPVIAALNTFVDEAILRPDASHRPSWASHRKFQLFFHLKSFMWSYHEMIWKAVANHHKDKPMTGRAMGVLVEATTIAALSAPLAMLGYELRKLLSWWGNPPAGAQQHGWGYAQEIIERSGVLGVVQMAVDWEQAEKYGRSSLLSLAGPTVGQMEEFLTDDFVNFATRATPLLAQMGQPRSFVRDMFK